MIHVSAQFSDNELVAEVKRLAEHERVATTDLIAVLAELDARRLYLGEGCSSLFSYCTHVLHLSEHAAYGRIEAARAARRHPVILDMLAAGFVNLTTVCLLAPHLTDENHVVVLNSARATRASAMSNIWLRRCGRSRLCPRLFGSCRSVCHRAQRRAPPREPPMTQRLSVRRQRPRPQRDQRLSRRSPPNATKCSSP
jgi:hypothetical protein